MKRIPGESWWNRPVYYTPYIIHTAGSVPLTLQDTSGSTHAASASASVSPLGFAMFAEMKITTDSQVWRRWLSTFYESSNECGHCSIKCLNRMAPSDLFLWPAKLSGSSLLKAWCSLARIYRPYDVFKNLANHRQRTKGRSRHLETWRLLWTRCELHSTENDNYNGTLLTHVSATIVSCYLSIS